MDEKIADSNPTQCVADCGPSTYVVKNSISLEKTDTGKIVICSWADNSGRD